MLENDDAQEESCRQRDKFQGLEIVPFTPPYFSSAYFSLRFISFATANTVRLYHKEPKMVPDKSGPTAHRSPTSYRLGKPYLYFIVNEIESLKTISFLMLLDCISEREKKNIS